MHLTGNPMRDSAAGILEGSVQQKLIGQDAKMRRLVVYWAATVCLYAVCVGILWIEVASGAAPVVSATWFTVALVSGHILFYLLIRLSNRFDIKPADLAEYQARFAITCTVAGYSIVGPIRGAILVVLLVTLVFCAFTLQVRKTYSLSIFAIVLLGAAMIWMAGAAPDRFDLKTELIHFFLISTMLTVVGFLTGTLSELRSRLKMQKAELEVQKTELAEALEHIRRLATHDELTSLPNRRHISSVLKEHEKHGPTTGTRGCLALLDIDWFKKINDRYGHAAGDEVLRTFSKEAQQVLRNCDMLARWGGEEFLLFLPQADLDAGGRVLERMRSCIQSLSFDFCSPPLEITFSAGLVELAAGEGITPAIGRADDLLYQAKAQGRNRIVAMTNPVSSNDE